MDKRDLDMSDVIADGERMRDAQTQTVFLAVTVSPAGQPDEEVAGDIRTALAGLHLDTPYEVTGVHLDVDAEADEHQKAHEGFAHEGCETCAASRQEAGYNEIVAALEEAGYKIAHLTDGILNVHTQDGRYVNTITVTRTPGY